MNKGLRVGERVLFFEPFEGSAEATHGIIDDIDEVNNWMSIIKDPINGRIHKVIMTARKVDGRWFAFNFRDRSYTLEIEKEIDLCGECKKGVCDLKNSPLFMVGKGGGDFEVMCEDHLMELLHDGNFSSVLRLR